jgi:thiamine-monophosphate kinase
MSELEFIRWLRDRIVADARVPVGPGDDAAVVRLAEGREAVVTTDLMVEGVHFDLTKTSPRLVGRKALAVNLSDIAAMAAEPVAAFVSVALPKNGGGELARELFAGIAELADEFGVAIAGGDTNRTDGPLVINITLLGQTTQRGPVLRSGARPGDAVLVTGELGGSLAGRHLTFQPRVREALLLHERCELHAMIDLSDGLATDLGHIVEESGGGAVLRAESIPISEAAVAAANEDGRGAIEHALCDGEDFELCFTLAEAEAKRLIDEQPLEGVAVHRIGTISREAGLWWETDDGTRRKIMVKGYEHALD